MLIYLVVLSNKNFYILGYSGHSYVILDSLTKLNTTVLGYFDFKKCKDSLNYYNLDYLGNERLVDLDNISSSNFVFPSIGDNLIRKNLVQFIEENKLTQTSIIDPQAIVSNKAIIESSVYVAPGAIINSRALIKKGSIVNSGATVEHECQLGEFSHVAPNAVLTGNVIIGKNTLVGANAVITPGVTIGNNVIIGAGSVVTKDLPDNSKWVGNPLRML
ncbi:acetyltransferase [Nonlabens mediterrranea]|uniref:Acetyltransferase n=1 Tax=Nonlabens mediterrranea TaxID=1419947 RepID=A0ABS0A8Q2_9FLAO|nr:acetyltransferase [Nonlabens mediterrranea]